MKKILLITIVCILCAGCGVKSEPEYKSKYTFIKNIYLV